MCELLSYSLPQRLALLRRGVMYGQVATFTLYHAEKVIVDDKRLPLY